jgi:gluconate kinase
MIISTTQSVATRTTKRGYKMLEQLLKTELTTITQLNGDDDVVLIDVINANKGE